MTWLVEDPLPILALGLVVTAAFGVALVQTGRRWLAIACLVTVLLTISLLALEHSVTTEVEQVENTLHSLADDLVRGDVPSILSHLSQHSDQLRREAEQKLPRVQIHKATIKRNLEISVAEARNELVAEAKFNAVLVVSARSGAVTNQTYPRFFVLNLRKEAGNWKVTKYEQHDPFQRSRPSGANQAMEFKAQEAD